MKTSSKLLSSVQCSLIRFLNKMPALCRCLYLILFIISVLKVKLCFARPVIQPGINVPPPEILKFMRTFGYLDSPPSDSEALYHEEAIVDAIKNVQLYGNLNQTGVLDNETLKLLTSPRCGVPDIQRRQSHRSKRYIVGAKSWQKRRITYFIANWSPKVGEAKVVEGMKNAFDAWARYSNLKFKRVYDPSADIIVAFGARYHGDNYPFDGPGNILAHAFYPYEMDSYGGDIHFDDEEHWKENATTLTEGVDFYSVAVHELGHSLGLAHSPVYSSIMFPYYKGAGSNNLDFDDILAMYELYIKRRFADDEEVQDTVEDYGDADIVTTRRSTTTSTTTSTRRPFVTFEGDFETIDDHQRKHGMITTPVPRPSTPLPSTVATEVIPNICLGNFDAVSVLRSEVFIFKGEYVWRISDKYRIMQGYPMNFHEMFNFLPSAVTQIDAIYERKMDNAIVIFTGRQYWVYDGHNLIENSPQSISNYGIADNITHIDAVMVWPKNQLTYLFSGDQFWRYSDQYRILDTGYPRSMARWPGIPDNINAATSMPNGKTYFFKDRLYWLYDNKLIRPARGYPRRASNAWLGCPLMQRRQHTRTRN